jgi:1,4-dihydroxy-2-naphthoate octaprenyltransferase
MNRLRTLYQLARPFQLLLSVLTFSLGLGVARYLGKSLESESIFIGLAFVLLVLAAANLLTEYFRPMNDPLVEGETLGEREEVRRVSLVTGLAFLAIAVLLIFLLLWSDALNMSVVLFLALTVLLALANAIPPFRLVDRGLGELVLALLVAYITPALAFALQKSDVHRLLAILTFPLTLLALAYFLIRDFPTYANDIKYNRRTLLVRLSWQRALPLHNILLVASYVLYAGTPFLSVPLTLTWPALLTLPLAGYQIFMLRNIAEGAKPLWNVLLINGAAIFGLTAYLLALTFWLH